MTDKNIPIGIDDGEVEIVTLLDENDNEVRFELIGGYVDKGVQYFALIPEAVLTRMADLKNILSSRALRTPRATRSSLILRMMPNSSASRAFLTMPSAQNTTTTQSKRQI